MKAKKRLPDLLFYMIMGTAYTFALCYAVIKPTALQIPASTILIWCLSAVAAFYIVFYNKWSLIAVTGLLIVSAVAVFIYLYVHEFEVEWYESLRVRLDILESFAFNQIPYDPAYDTPISLALTVALALMTAVTLQAQFSFYTLVILGAGIIGVLPLFGHERDTAATLLFVFCSVVFLVKQLGLYAGEKDGGSSTAAAAAMKPLAFSLIPLCLIVTAAAVCLPRPSSVDSGEFTAGSAVSRIFDMVNLSGTGGFGVGSGDTIRLGGVRRFTGRVVMEVYAEEAVYLAGQIMDTYTGNSWTMSDTAEHKSLPDSQGYYDILSYYNSNIYLYSTTKTVLVLPASGSRTAFVPAYAARLGPGEDTEVYMDTYGMVSFDNANSDGYEIHYLDVYGVVSVASVVSEDGEGYMVQYGDPDADVYGYASNQESYGREQYLTLPDSLPERVYELAREITGEASGDNEKMRMLEEYLKQFPYTLTPGRVPSGADFVDHFLFTGQEGYCTYYATALTVLARAVGIPARYVEGYIMPPERNDAGGWTVTDAQAHAWVEAVIPGRGWVRFDPTPASALAAAETLAARTTEPAETIPATDDAAAAAVTETPVAAGESAGTEQGSGVPVTALIVIGILAVLAAIAIALLRPLLKLRKIEKLPNREAAIAYFGRILSEAKRAGYPIAPTETALTYAERVEGEAGADGGVPMRSLAGIFSRAAYSLEEISDDDKAKMRDAYHVFRRQTKV